MPERTLDAGAPPVPPSEPLYSPRRLTWTGRREVEVCFAVRPPSQHRLAGWATKRPLIGPSLERLGQWEARKVQGHVWRQLI
jgi:hypothetical protein